MSHINVSNVSDAEEEYNASELTDKSSSSSSDVLEEHNANSQSFQDKIKEYLVIENEIKDTQSSLKILKQRKDELSGNILAYMEENRYPEIQVTHGKLMREEKQSKKPLNKEMIKTCLKSEFDDNKASKLTDDLFTKRPTVKKINLKVIRSVYSSQTTNTTCK